MNTTTIETHAPLANNSPVRQGPLAAALIILMIFAAALGAMAQRTLANTKPADTSIVPVTVTPPPTHQNAGFENVPITPNRPNLRCRATHPDTKVVTMQYVYPNSECSRPIVLVKLARPASGSQLQSV